MALQIVWSLIALPRGFHPHLVRVEVVQEIALAHHFLCHPLIDRHQTTRTQDLSVTSRDCLLQAHPTQKIHHDFRFLPIPCVRLRLTLQKLFRYFRKKKSRSCWRLRDTRSTTTPHRDPRHSLTPTTTAAQGGGSQDGIRKHLDPHRTGPQTVLCRGRTAGRDQERILLVTVLSGTCALMHSDRKK